MRKAARLMFCLLALAACFQLAGLEEAFCEDSAMETGCRECMTCAGHQYTGAADPFLLPVIVFSGYPFSSYRFRPIENPPLNLLRPPIAR